MNGFQEDFKRNYKIKKNRKIIKFDSFQNCEQASDIFRGKDFKDIKICQLLIILLNIQKF